jgi:peptidoglycan/LPS O-acetylase OafA/YrhL
MSAGRSRLAFIDAFKALASQLIVLHHLAFYGPMSDYVQPLFPGMISWFSQNARIAVQVFLVIGGFLAAQALARNGRLVEKPVLALIWRRYLKLVLPYLAALLLAIAGAAIARHLITHASIPGAPTLPQLIAHVFLLQKHPRL